MRGYVTAKGRQWYAVVYEGLDPVTGRERRRWHPAGCDRADAERLARRLADAEHARRGSGRSRLTFAGFVARYWLPAKRMQLRATTIDGYERMLRLHILPALGATTLRQLGPEAIQDLYGRLLLEGRTDDRGGLSPKTVHEVHAVVRNILDDAVRRGLLVANPARLAASPRWCRPRIGRWPIMTQPYETPAFRNSAQFTVAVTFVVAGGQRSVTADRRARRIFEQIANHTARLKDVLEVAAVGGPSDQGQLLWSHPVAFTAANTGTGPLRTGKLLRYHDPDSERAKRLLAAATAPPDADARTTAGDAAPSGAPTPTRRFWRRDVTAASAPTASPKTTSSPPDAHPTCRPGPRARCLCGQPVPRHGQRCSAHRGIHLELLDGDPPPCAS